MFQLRRLFGFLFGWIGRIPPLPRLTRFYRKRTPFGRNEPKEFQHPGEEDAYQESLYWEGFITPDFWDEEDLRSYPAINQDLDDLDQYLLPAFWEYNQKARYFQHSYHYYQWVFIIGAFLTTVFGAATTYYRDTEIVLSVPNVPVISQVLRGAEAVSGGDEGGTPEAPTIGIDTVFSLLTTVVSAITSYFTLLSNQGEPRKRWANYRRLAEELRMLYFKFVSRVPPYDKANRVDRLRRRVIEIREQEPASA